MKKELYDYDGRKEWTPELCQRFWTLYMEGKGLKTISEMLGLSCTENEMKCKRWKIICGGGRYKAGQIVVAGPDRRGKPWSEHDAKVIKIAREAEKPVPLDRLADLMGRDVKELEKLLHKGKRTTFF